MRFTEALGAIKKGLEEVSKKYANFPDSYIKRSMEQIYWKTPRGQPQYLNRTVERRKYRYTMNRPWTAQFYQQNMPGKHRKKVFIEPVGEISVYVSTKARSLSVIVFHFRKLDVLPRRSR